MLRKKLSLLLILSLLLTGCGLDTPKIENADGPGRMVRRIEIAVQPEDPSYARTYTTQENMNELLAILRSMQTDEEALRDPDLDGGQVLYTATVTFANGQQSVYYLLGHTYLRLHDEDWCVISPEQSKNFTQYILDHPSDDTAATTAPVT